MMKKILRKVFSYESLCKIWKTWYTQLFGIKEIIQFKLWLLSSIVTLLFYPNSRLNKIAILFSCLLHFSFKYNCFVKFHWLVLSSSPSQFSKLPPKSKPSLSDTWMRTKYIEYLLQLLHPFDIHNAPQHFQMNLPHTLFSPVHSSA